eukprot:g7756.t1
MLYARMSGGQYEGFVNTFSRSSSHAVDLSRAIARSLRLDKLADERAARADGDITRIADLGSGPGVALGWILREEGLVREVFAQSDQPAGAGALSPPKALYGRPDASGGGGGGTIHPVIASPGVVLGKAAAADTPLSVWCADPFYCPGAPAEPNGPPAVAAAGSGNGGGFGGSSHLETTLPTEDVGGGGGGGCRLEIVGGGRVHFVSAEAVEFLQSCQERVGRLDRVLMKEMIHHVRDYAALGWGLREALRPGTGMALISGRTPSDTIPWFPQAERKFAESCMDLEHICKILRSVPGLRVASSDHVFEVRLKLADWCALLRGRFWSHLDKISDEDMERGISEVREVYGHDDSASLVFRDPLKFVRVFRDHDAQQA